MHVEPTIDKRESYFRIASGGTNSTTIITWLEEFLKNLPEIYDDDNPFALSETFEYDRKQKTIKKQMHKKRKMDDNQTMIVTTESIAMDTRLPTPNNLATTKSVISQVLREDIFKMMGDNR
jgi:hypothetical protein